MRYTGENSLPPSFSPVLSSSYPKIGMCRHGIPGACKSRTVRTARRRRSEKTDNLFTEWASLWSCLLSWCWVDVVQIFSSEFYNLGSRSHNRNDGQRQSSKTPTTTGSKLHRYTKINGCVEDLILLASIFHMREVFESRLPSYLFCHKGCTLSCNQEVLRVD